MSIRLWFRYDITYNINIHLFFISGNYNKWTFNNESNIVNNLNETFGSNYSETTTNSSTLTNTNLTFESEHAFCEYTPFMLAFVTLLLKWIMLVLLLFCCGSCTICAGYSMRKEIRKGNLPQDDPEHFLNNNLWHIASLWLENMHYKQLEWH